MVSHCGFDLHFPNDIEHLFMCLLATGISSSEKCLLKSFALDKIELFVFLLSNCKNSIYILGTRPLPDIQLAKLFSHSVNCLFILLLVSFDAQSF